MFITDLIAFIVGFVVLMIGAEFVLRSGSRLAALIGVKPLVIGLTVVSIGTSFPELAVGITASLQGSGSLAVGNIAGTNIFNILFILGLSALILPLPIHLEVLKLDLPVVVIAAALMTILAWDGTLTQLDGGLMLAAAVLYTIVLLRMSRRESREVQKEFEEVCGLESGEACETDGHTRDRKRRRLKLNSAVLLLTGMAVTIIGAEWLVAGAIGISRWLNVSEAVIGLTVIAIGTSAPELATTIVATLRNDRDVAVGNLLGSSIYNILVILAITCLVTPGGLPVEHQLLSVDIPLMMGVTILCVPIFLTGKSISRIEGGLGILTYLAYMIWVILFRA